MKLFTSKLSAVLLSACMVLPVLSNGATVSCNNTAIAAETADAAIKFNNEDQFFVYVGTYSGGIPQFRYLYPTSDGSYNADKVIWEDAPTDLAYGDIFVADGDVPMTQVYPAADDPANAHVYYYMLDEGAKLNKAGNCSDLMEQKDLSVTSKTYDGSSHWSVRYMDAAGEEYYYGLSTFASSLGVDPLDCEVGDVYTYALYNNYMVAPLAKQTETITDTMTVEVVEVHDKYLLVKPTDRPNSNERLTLSMEYIDTGVNPSVGMKYEVTYTGGILETYPEQFGNVQKVTMVSYENELPAGATRITLYDKDTGELIPNEVLEANPFKFHADIVYTPNLFSTVGATTGIADYTVTTNEAILDECYLCPELSSLAMAYKKADTFNITTEEQPEITYYDNGSMDIVFKLKFTPTGDANSDGEFNVADVVLLQKWLLAVPDTHLANWKAVDFCNDNVLNVFDLCLMKRELIRTTVTTYVEPDHRSTYGAPLYVVKDGLNLYLGPDGSYASIATLPEGTQLHELGYNDNNYNWLFTEYNGQYGWIRTYEDDNKTRTVEYLAQPDKPVIYL